MYELQTRDSQPSLKTKIWIQLVKILRGWNTPKLYSYQSTLPRLPLPSVHDTMTRVSDFVCFDIVCLLSCLFIKVTKIEINTL